jgi:hypothetical protein
MLGRSSMWALFVVVLGCESEPFDASGYDRTCAMPSDCVVVYSGDPCGCACEQTSIATSEQARYQDDRREYVNRVCPEGPPDCGPCPESPDPACNAGTCGLAP